MPESRRKSKWLLLILGIISVCSIVGISALLLRAKRTSVNSVLIACAQLKSIQYALEMYYNDYASFPSQTVGLAALRDHIGRGPYITDDANSDPWNRPF